MTKKLLIIFCFIINQASFGQTEWTATDFSYNVVPTKFIEHKNELYGMCRLSIFGKAFRYTNNSWVALNTANTVGEPHDLMDAGDTLFYHTIQPSPKVSRTYYSLDKGETFQLLLEKSRLMYMDSYYNGVTYYTDLDAVCKYIGDSCYALGGRNAGTGKPTIGYKGPVTVVGDSIYMVAGGTVMHVSGDGGATFTQYPTNLNNYQVQMSTNFRQLYDASTATFYLAAGEKDSDNLVAGILASKDHGRTWTEHFFTEELKSIDVPYNQNLARSIYAFDIKGDVIAVGYTKNAPKSRPDILTSFSGFDNVKLDTLGFPERTKFESEGVYPGAFKIFNGKIFVSVSDGKVYSKDIDGMVNSMNSENSMTQNVQVFPNPTNGKLTVTTSDTQERLNISLHSVDGRLLKESTVNNMTSFDYKIDSPKGVYFLKIVNNKTKEAGTIKVIKK